MTNRDAVSDVKSALRLHNADVSISDRAILRDILNVRNKYVKQATDRRKLWESPNLFLPLKISLEEVPEADYQEFQSQCRVSRSTHRIPKIMDSGLFGLIIQGAYSLTRKRRFVLVTPERFVNLSQLDIPGHIIYYWFFDDYIWTSDPNLESLILPALLEGAGVPRHFRLENECQDCPTNPLDEDFRCPGYMVKDITLATVQYLMQTYKRSVEDTTSNDKDETR